MHGSWQGAVTQEVRPWRSRTGREGAGRKPGQGACNLPRAQIQGPERACQNASPPAPATVRSCRVTRDGVRRNPNGPSRDYDSETWGRSCVSSSRSS